MRDDREKIRMVFTHGAFVGAAIVVCLVSWWLTGSEPGEGSLASTIVTFLDTLWPLLLGTGLVGFVAERAASTFGAKVAGNR